MFELIMQVVIYGLMLVLGVYFVCAFVWYVIVPGYKIEVERKLVEGLRYKYGLEVQDEFKDKEVAHIVCYGLHGVYRYMGDETSLKNMGAELYSGENPMSVKVMLFK